MAGMLATGLADLPDPVLLVDIGTNGEIVLWADGKLSSASTAAGPAFEGARISQGMRASAGAIEKVVVDGCLRINVIGDVPPVGLCGSALVYAAARTPSSRGELTERKAPLRQRCARRAAPRFTSSAGRTGRKTALPLASEAESGSGRAVLLTQRDFANCNSPPRIRAGIGILLKGAGLKPGDLDAVLIAGGFGNFIRRSNAQRIGLLPEQVPRNRIRYQGNTSLAGGAPGSHIALRAAVCRGTGPANRTR